MSAGPGTGAPVPEGDASGLPLVIGDGEADGEATGGVGQGSGDRIAGAELMMPETGVSTAETVLLRGVGRRPVVFAIGVRTGSTTVGTVVRSEPVVRAAPEITGFEARATPETAGLIAALTLDVVVEIVAVMAPLTGASGVAEAIGFAAGGSVVATAEIAVLTGARDELTTILIG